MNRGLPAVVPISVPCSFMDIVCISGYVRARVFVCVFVCLCLCACVFVLQPVLMI